MTSRLDHRLTTAPGPRGIYYGASGSGAVDTCLAEVFQDGRTIDRNAKAPWLVGLEIVRDVSLLDLTGTWPTRAGASMAINSGPRPRARRWSQAIYAQFTWIEGLLYASSMHRNQPALALYERAQNALPAAPLFNRALADPSLTTRLAAAARRIGYRLV